MSDKSAIAPPYLFTQVSTVPTLPRFPHQCKFCALCFGVTLSRESSEPTSGLPRFGRSIDHVPWFRRHDPVAERAAVPAVDRRLDVGADAQAAEAGCVSQPAEGRPPIVGRDHGAGGADRCRRRAADSVQSGASAGRRGRRSRRAVVERIWPTPEQVVRIAEQAGVLGGPIAWLVITAAWAGC
ncbi:hypothetical protein [Amycolatopsis sp. NPDC004169]|uniref:hypothetical protein n=1 Tax=Amycolatopsis sp. NPDC004169 TaxID=3154453 RepID=UPI0033A70C05